MHRFTRILFGLTFGMAACRCFAAEAFALPLPALLPVTLQKHEAGTFYIRGAIEGYGELDLLVDTGASYLVINEKILRALKDSGDAEYSRELRGTMADGSARVIPIYHLTALRLGTTCWIRQVEAAVFPGGSRPILGMNVLARLSPFTFSAEPPQLGLAQCQSTVSSENASVGAVGAGGSTSSAAGLAQ